jgi:sigma-E factor negative regulatory protein RseA
MSEQIREQVSAFLDGELPNSETELLLKRLTRDAELRESFGRYALIGESLRGGGGARLSQSFHTRVNRAIDGEPLTGGQDRHDDVRLQRWWRAGAGATVAAGVMAVAVLSFQQRADAPIVVAALPPATVRPVTEAALTDAKPREALSYTVPAAVGDAPAAMPAARLTSYVFAHSKYSSVLGQSNVLSGLLTDADEQEAAAPDNVSLPKGAHDGSP